MKKRYVIAIALLLIGAGLPLQAAQVGMVVSADGSGEVLRQGEVRPLRLADSLFSGDQLRVKTGQASFLFCPTGELVRLTAGSTVVLDDSGYHSQEGPAPVAQGGRKCALPKVALGAESLERVGGLRARGFPPVTVYLGGPVSTTRPVFRWEAVDGTVDYEIRIKDPRGRLLFEGRSATTQWQPSEDLAAGTYQWEILAQGATETIAQQLARFSIKPVVLDTSSGDDVASLLTNATVFENEGYFSEAAEYYRKLRTHFPDDRRLTSRLAWLYWNSGLIVASNLESERLRGGAGEN